MGLYRDNGKENGNYYLGFGVWDLRVGVWGLGFRVWVQGLLVIAGCVARIYSVPVVVSCMPNFRNVWPLLEGMTMSKGWDQVPWSLPRKVRVLELSKSDGSIPLIFSKDYIGVM